MYIEMHTNVLQDWHLIWYVSPNLTRIEWKPPDNAPSDRRFLKRKVANQISHRSTWSKYTSSDPYRSWMEHWPFGWLVRRYLLSTQRRQKEKLGILCKVVTVVCLFSQETWLTLWCASGMSDWRSLWSVCHPVRFRGQLPMRHDERERVTLFGRVRLSCC
jgi:hypothetical protein